MAAERVGDMTVQELETLVNRLIERRLPQVVYVQQPGERSFAEVLASMRTNLIKRAPGQPSTLAMLRADRDQ